MLLLYGEFAVSWPSNHKKRRSRSSTSGSSMRWRQVQSRSRNHDPNISPGGILVVRDASITVAIVIRTWQRQLQTAMSGESLCIPFFGVMFQFESASLGFPKTWLTGYVVRLHWNFGILVWTRRFWNSVADSAWHGDETKVHTRRSKGISWALSPSGFDLGGSW